MNWNEGGCGAYDTNLSLSKASLTIVFVCHATFTYEAVPSPTKKFSRKKNSKV